MRMQDSGMNVEDLITLSLEGLLCLVPGLGQRPLHASRAGGARRRIDQLAERKRLRRCLEDYSHFSLK